MLGNCSIAKKQYRKRMARIMLCYVVVLFSCTWLARHEKPEDTFVVYFFSVLPAVPVLVLIATMGRYLREEHDEFQRQQAVVSILIGTGALLGTIVVSDFLRILSSTPALPPFVLFCTFFVGMGITQGVQTIRYRPAPESADDQ